MANTKSRTKRPIDGSKQKSIWCDPWNFERTFRLSVELLEYGMNKYGWLPVTWEVAIQNPGCPLKKL